MTKYKDTIYESFYDKLYNPEMKIKFIEENYPVNKDTKIAILYYFRKAATTERFYDKDLCIFNTEEILDLTRRLGYNTVNTMSSALSYFSSYVNWCISNKLRGSYENGINDVSIFLSTQDLSRFLPRFKAMGRYLTKEEVYDLVDYLYNIQDMIVVLALYEGILGERLHELRHLKMTDVNTDNNTVKLTDADGSVRVKKISYKLIDLILHSREQTEYYQNNAETESKSTAIRPLSESQYILRPIRRLGNEGEPFKYGSFTQKIVKIKRYVDYPFISATSLFDSGAINRVNELTVDAGLDEPNDEIFNKLASKSEYNLSDSALYGFKQKYKLATSLKRF